MTASDFAIHGVRSLTATLVHKLTGASPSWDPLHSSLRVLEKVISSVLSHFSARASELNGRISSSASPVSCYILTERHPTSLRQYRNSNLSNKMAAPLAFSMFSLEGQTAVITGGTRGIGQAAALALAECGADIILIQVYSTLPTTHPQLFANKKSAA